MKALITGGGTGGHIYPAIAIALNLRKKGWDILYLGSKNSLEENIAKEWDIDFIGVNVAPLPRNLSLKLFKSLGINFKGLYQAKKIIKKNDIDIVFGTGGFVAGPVVLAAYLGSIPTIIHEQNVYPGITNKLLSYISEKIAVNFIDSKKYFPKKSKNKLIETGIPVRDKIFNIEKEKAIDYFNFDLTKKTLLIFGGSQGALSINKAVLGIYKLLTKNENLQLIHITGKKNYKNHLNLLKKNNINLEKYKNIKVISYLEHMEYAYTISDLVISRAGATGLAEITASALAAILIPYPYATGNHQYYNAKILENKGAAKVIKEKDLNEDLMLKEFKDIIYDKEKLKEMSLNSKKLAEKNATQKIIKEIENIVK